MSWWTSLRNKIEGDAQTVFTADEQALVTWAHNLLVQITPVIKQAAEDAVSAAVSVPGNDEVKAAAALTTAIADLTSKGVPIVTNAIKGAIEIAFANTVAPAGAVTAPVATSGAGSGSAS